MSFDAARQALFTLVQSVWTTAGAPVPLEYQNLEMIDMNSRADPFLACEIVFREALQVSLESSPRTRYFGELNLYVHVKDGQGTKAAMGYCGTFASGLKYQRVSGVQLQAPRLKPTLKLTGWTVWVLSVSFQYDEL